MKFKKTAIAIGAALLTTGAGAWVPYEGCDNCTYTSGPSLPDYTPHLAVFDNTPITAEIEIPTQTAGLREWFINFVTGGGNDRGDWKCSSCPVIPDSSNATEWGEFITTVVNRELWPSLRDSAGNYIGAWRPNDTVSICNGSGQCVILTYHWHNGTVSWLPNPANTGRVVKPDKGKYKNKEGAASAPATAATPIYDQGGAFMMWMVSDVPIYQVTSINIRSSAGQSMSVSVGPVVTVSPGAPLPPAPPAPGGGGGGNSCVHVDSRLPDGRRAGDIRVGDTIQLGDEKSPNCETKIGIVTYSKATMARGYRIVTRSGISLLCSDTAPIWTDEGFIKAPELLGKKVAVRVDGTDITTRFEAIEVVAEVGLIEVQHISVGDRAFWAGAEHGSYILHHNKYVPEDGVQAPPPPAAM